MQVALKNTWMGTSIWDKWNRYNIHELRDMLEDNGLDTWGPKAKLIRRLVLAAIPDPWDRNVCVVHKPDIDAWKSAPPRFSQAATTDALPCMMNLNDKVKAQPDAAYDIDASCHDTDIKRS